MLQYQIYDQQKDPNQYLYKITKYLRDERLKNKKLAKETGNVYYKDLEQSQKIAINSLYGFLGAPGLQFNSPTNASLITKLGRENLQRTIEWATGIDYETWKKNNNLQDL